MSATDYTTLIARIRNEGADTLSSNPRYGEVPAGVRDGNNKVFKLANANIVSGTIATVQYGPYVNYGANVRQLAAGTFPFSIDTLNGLATFTGAPDSGATQPFTIDYFFQFFTDAEYTAMIDAAGEELGVAAGTAVAEGLYPAQIKYALERYWTRRATVWAIQYTSAGGGASEDATTPAQTFLALAKEARKAGDNLMKLYYTSQGQNLKPASGTFNYKFDPYTPKR